jgi:hypothetical protein
MLASAIRGGLPASSLGPRPVVNCFGADQPLREFTAGDAKDFRDFLKRQPKHPGCSSA